MTNLLILVDDQHRWDALGCAGQRAPREASWLRRGVTPVTPNLDRLAATGVRFSQAVANVPVCIPSRHSFITGMRGHQLGVLTNSHYWPDRLPVPTLGDLLKDAGYATAAIGKMHWKPHNAPAEHVPDKRGFDLRISYDGEATDGPCDQFYDDFATAEERAIHRDWARRFGRGGENRAGYVGEVSRIPSSRMHDHWLAERATAFLARHHDTREAKPFALVVSLDRPHPENVIPSDYADYCDPDQMPLPPPVPDGFVEDDHYLAALRHELGWDRMDEKDLRLSVARYLANVRYVDHCYGLVLDALARHGHEQDTVVAVLSDHGEMLGERDRAHTKYGLYDAAIRVPLIVRWPGVNRPGLVSDALVELIDLMPTCLDAAALPIPEHLPGRSLRPLLQGEPPDALGWRTATISEHYTPVATPGAPRAQWAVRGTRYKLIERLSAPSALYDLHTDPDEHHNLIDDPAFACVLAELRAVALHETMTAAERYPATSTVVGSVQPRRGAEVVTRSSRGRGAFGVPDR